jgi:hypothetical protein
MKKCTRKFKPVSIRPRRGSLSVSDREKLVKLIGRAVVVKWVSPDNDWHYFRLESVHGDDLGFTGMTDPDGSTHLGDFFTESLGKIVSISQRLA